MGAASVLLALHQDQLSRAMEGTVNLAIDRTAPTTLIAQVVDGIAQLIADGALAPGDRLPPTRNLARQLGTTRGTIVAAYDTLLASGTLEAHVGRGTFVARASRARAAAANGARHAPVTAASIRLTSGLPIVPAESDTARTNGAATRPDASAAIRAFWDAILGERPRMDTHESSFLGRDTQGAITFAYAVPPAELFPLTEFRRASDKALLVRGRELLQLGPADGFPPLRREIAARMNTAGSAIDPEDIIVTTGSQQSLDLVRRVLVRRGDAVIVEDPAYPGAIQLLRSVGATLVPWSVDERGWDMEALAATLRDKRARLIYVSPDFQNPTGRVMDLASRERLLALAVEHGVPIIEDDIVSDLRFSGERLPTLKSLDRHGVVVYLGSFSKTTFPGIRLGWIAASSTAHEMLVDAKQATDLQTSGPTQAAMYEFLRSGALDAHLERVCREYARRRDALNAALRVALPGECTWLLPEGGLSLWLRLPDDIDADRVAARALDARVAVSQGRYFYCGLPRMQALRLAFALHPPDVAEEGAKRLGKVIRAVAAERSTGMRTRRGRSRTALV